MTRGEKVRRTILARHGEDFYSRIGSKGGRALRAKRDMVEMGRHGGQHTRDNRGVDYLRELARRGGQAGRGKPKPGAGWRRTAVRRPAAPAPKAAAKPPAPTGGPKSAAGPLTSSAPKAAARSPASPAPKAAADPTLLDGKTPGQRRAATLKARFGPDYYARLGRRGGEAVRDQGTDMAALGRAGGEKIKTDLGVEHYRSIGKQGGAAGRGSPKPGAGRRRKTSPRTE